jgi:hypothetical protein
MLLISAVDCLNALRCRMPNPTELHLCWQEPFRLLECRADPLPQDGGDDDWEDVAPEAGAFHFSRLFVNLHGLSLDLCLGAIPVEWQESGLMHVADGEDAGGVDGAVPTLKNTDPAVLECLRGSYKLLVGRHLPAVLEWLAVAVKVLSNVSSLHITIDDVCASFRTDSAFDNFECLVL